MLKALGDPDSGSLSGGRANLVFHAHGETGETGKTSRMVALETGKQSILHSGWPWLTEGTKSRESMQCR